MKGIKSKPSIGKLFYNDKFVMLFSILVAFVIWVSYSSTSQETTIFTITDIPVTMPELSNDMRVFSSSDITAEVKISGNAIVVAGVTSSDIYITAADTSEITQPGTYRINLVPKKTGIKTDYRFESTVSPSSVEVFVDRYAEKEFTLTDNVKVSSVAEGSYASTTMLSEQIVKVTGAESIINSIVQASAEYNFTDPLSKTASAEAVIVFYDASGNVVPTDYINSDKRTVTATVPILKIKTVSIIPTYINTPDSFTPDDSMITIEPSEIQIAVPDDADSVINYISTSEIDLTKVNAANNKHTVDLNIPSGCRNLNQITTADVIFDKTKLATKTISLTKFTVINQAADRRATVSTKSVDVTLIGSAEQISSITAANITAFVDMSSKNSTTGFLEMPLTISINSKFPFVWTYGTYQVDVNVTDSQASVTS